MPRWENASYLCGIEILERYMLLWRNAAHKVFGPKPAVLLNTLSSGKGIVESHDVMRCSSLQHFGPLRVLFPCPTRQRLNYFVKDTSTMPIEAFHNHAKSENYSSEYPRIEGPDREYIINLPEDLQQAGLRHSIVCQWARLGR